MDEAWSAPRREFIPHTGDKHFVHHADRAVRRTHVYCGTLVSMVRGLGRPRQKIWQAEGQDEPSSARVTMPKPGPPQTMEKHKKVSCFNVVIGDTSA